MHFRTGNATAVTINASAQSFSEAVNIITGTGTGTKIATAANQKLGLWGAVPVVQPTSVADATDAASVIVQLNALLSRIRTIGAIAT